MKKYIYIFDIGKDLLLYAFYHALLTYRTAKHKFYNLDIDRDTNTLSVCRMGTCWIEPKIPNIDVPDDC